MKRRWVVQRTTAPRAYGSFGFVIDPDVDRAWTRWGAERKLRRMHGQPDSGRLIVVRDDD